MPANVCCFFARILIVLFALLAMPSVSGGQSSSVSQAGIAASRRNALVQAVEKASPAVVNISTTRIEQVNVRPFFDDFWVFNYPFEIPQQHELHGLGSGVIIDREGYVLTNQHVIHGADETKVILFDGREFEAEIIGEDFLSDLAMLKIDAPGLIQIALGDSDDLLIGEWAIAIGHPFAAAVGNPRPTVTMGVVSATNRALKTEDRLYQHLIQTDASINPGNSGGALTNMYGKLIGINAAIYSTSGGSQGIGFAIPVNTAKKIINPLVLYGAVVPPYLGIEGQELTADLVEELELGGRTGVLVSSVDRGSPAKEAGVRRGDVIEAVNQQSTPNLSVFNAVTRLLDEKQRVTFQIIRNRKRRDVELSIQELQWSYDVPGWGITIEQIDRKTARKYQQHGVLVTKLDHRSTLVGLLKREDLLYQINDSKMNSVENFKRIINQLQRHQRVTLYFERDGERLKSRNLIIQ